jgi:TetR/AcrR family transcriptional regulator, cholesterol catabolism regulator
MEVKISKKEKIEQVATSLFKEKGYNATSMRQLAEALNIEAASLYSHIKSKEEILQKICFRMAEDFFQAIEEILNKPLPPSKKLEQAIIAHINVITKDPDATAVFSNDWKHLSEPFVSDLMRMRNSYEEKFGEIIRQGVEAKEFVSLNPRLTVITILSSLNSVYTWYRPQGKLSPEKIGEEVSYLVLNGLSILK